ncbi:uncharacterized protein N7443_005204 [Penicillium atrosanguineum]|uniref:uncharacterized protein n=1 Tax=Penicillium atrosanguineum TaxID=1132637 RepID=UPI002384D861|nr:uncharacterized protein N7443_005204 [Penicillium atrosanguineum]KAJ5305544.1 hypothetical protein N7443_005204 [Penicillium atrosanguineum]
MPQPIGTLVHALGHNWLGKADIAVQTVLLAAGFAAVGLRLWSRRLQQTSWQWNDRLILGAAVLMLGRYIIELVLILLCGMGLHSFEVARSGGAEAFVRFNQVPHICGRPFWCTVVCLVQVSLLHYYLGRFQQQVIMWLTYTVMGLCTALWIATFFATAFFCNPPSKVWWAGAQGHCGDRKMLHTATAVSEVILNGFILLLPLPIVRHMRLARARKVALGLIYILGIVIVAISAVRIKIESNLDPEDPTYGSARKSLIACIAPLLGIIAVCLPLLPPAIQQLFGTSVFCSAADGPASDSPSAGYWKTTVMTEQMEEPEIPLVIVAPPPMAKKLSELAHGQIKITSDWEIHSARNSARLDRDPIQQGSKL